MSVRVYRSGNTNKKNKPMATLLTSVQFIQDVPAGKSLNVSFLKRILYFFNLICEYCNCCGLVYGKDTFRTTLKNV